MLKVLSLVALILIGDILAAGLSCSSCGSDCVPACGTRRFRICCFNHLKRKRGFPPLMIEDVPDGDPNVLVMRKALLIIEGPELWWGSRASTVSRMNRTN